MQITPTNQDDQPITIQSMCQQAPDLFRISAQFLLVEPYLPTVLA